MQNLLRITLVSAILYGASNSIEAATETTASANLSAHNILKPWLWNSETADTIGDSLDIVTAVLSLNGRTIPVLATTFVSGSVALSRCHLNPDNFARPIDYARYTLGLAKIAYCIGKQIKPFRNLFSGKAS